MGSGGDVEASSLYPPLLCKRNGIKSAHITHRMMINITLITVMSCDIKVRKNETLTCSRRIIWWIWWLYRVKASGGGGLWSSVSVSQLRSCSASDTAGGPVWSCEAERIRITAAVSVERTERHRPEKWALIDKMKPAQITQDTEEILIYLTAQEHLKSAAQIPEKIQIFLTLKTLSNIFNKTWADINLKIKFNIK